MDTDHISILQKRSEPEFSAITNRLAQCAEGDLAFPIISFHEQLLGCHTFISRAKTTEGVIRGYRLLDEVRQGFTVAPILLFDSAAGTIFEDLLSQKIRVGTMDLRIASIALAHDLTLMTRNRNDFEKVPDLATEDWTQ